jgi:hypothetical protein
MVEHPLAFEFSKTRTICDAFDEAWAFLQGLGSRVENDGMMARLKAFNRPESLRRTSTSSRSSNARRIGASGKAGFAPIPGFQLRYNLFS